MKKKPKTSKCHELFDTNGALRESGRIQKFILKFPGP